jgi:isoquinoline 1-oxidoreductase beta subunit
LPRERITVHTTYLGGGFGRRAAGDFVAEAVDLSSRVGRPVQVLWSREDDMRHGFYRPAVAQTIEAAIGHDGLPSAWLHRVASVSTGEPTAIDRLALMGAYDLPYALGAIRVEWVGVQAPIPTSIWRSVGHSFTTFAIEAFLDELAYSVGRDPVAYRLSLLPADHRLRRCIEEVAALCAWPSTATGRDIRVARAWCAVDCGIAIHPDSVVAQIEGGVLFGLTAALLGRVTVAEGSVVEGNFDSYPLLRIDEAPDIEVKLLPSAEHPGGVGELGVPPVAAAVVNAVFAARKTRIRTLPLALSP